MDRQNTYEIELTFKRWQDEKVLFNDRIPYIGSGTYKDNVSITSHSIIIIAKRSSKINLEQIFYNHSSSLYNQILKTLLFYYSSIGVFNELENIKITRKRLDKELDKKELEHSGFQQILDKSFKLNYAIQKNSLTELFNDTEKGFVILTAISYLLKANSITVQSNKFEKLWKAFNILYRHIGKKPTEKECLIELRKFILANSASFPLSTKEVLGLTTIKLRNSISWRAMILNDFNSESQTQYLKGFILRYNDVRIMEIIKETRYLYREDFLKKQNVFTEVETHVNKKIAENKQDQCELVSFLSLKYMYYLRNKTFHGEKIDSEFRLLFNKETKEYEFLNNILEKLIFDLINCSTLY